MQSTQTILSNKGQPGRMHFVKKFENVKELIVQSGLSYQMIVSQEISEIERPLFGTGASALSVPQVDAKYLRQLGLLQQWYVFRGERTGILRFLEKYPFLVSLLVEVYPHIKEFFPLVREQFINRADQDYQEIGETLDRLSGYRNIADYDLNHPVLNNLPFTTQATLRWAKEALAKLQQMRRT